jgi:shikimate kinase
MTDVIIGTGGGTPCHGENMALMNRAGITVWLTTSPERITARLLLPEQKCKRPKICHLPDEALLPMVEAELRARTPYYDQAQMQFDSTDIETAEATERTACRLASMLNHKA